jgi:DNA polymerase I-like protein with 3'-5' exonuclease and polymerase domains
VMKCESGMRARTIRNFPIQATAAEVLHVACVLAERRGIGIVAPVHDALMAKCALPDVDATAAALDRCMRDAAAVVAPTSKSSGRAATFSTTEATRCFRRLIH